MSKKPLAIQGCVAAIQPEILLASVERGYRAGSDKVFEAVEQDTWQVSNSQCSLSILQMVYQLRSLKALHCQIKSATDH